MARRQRDQAAGIRHITCRGNRRQPVFVDDFDRERYLALLTKVSRELGWRVLAYCLMGNHVHLVVDVPAKTISRGMQLLSGQYAQAYNRRWGFTGHLWQGRFHDVHVIRDAHSFHLARYVVLNPTRAGLVELPVQWRWSSYRAMIGLAPAPAFLDTEWTLKQFGMRIDRARQNYAAFIDAGVRLLVDAHAAEDRGQTPGHEPRRRVPPGRVPDD